jgi:hypothetical protein
MYCKFDVTENLFLHSALFNATKHSISIHLRSTGSWSKIQPKTTIEDFKYRSYFDLKHEVDRLDLEPGNRLVNLQVAVCGVCGP